jgi:hypothetical protein
LSWSIFPYDYQLIERAHPHIHIAPLSAIIKNVPQPKVAPFPNEPPVEPPVCAHLEDIAPINTTIACLDPLHGEPIADSAFYGEVNQANMNFSAKVDDSIDDGKQENLDLVGIDGAIKEALDVSKEGIFIANPFKNIVIAASTALAIFTLVTCNVIINNNHINTSIMHHHDLTYINGEDTNLFPFDNGIDDKFCNAHKYIPPWPPPYDLKFIFNEWNSIIHCVILHNYNINVVIISYSK